MHDKEVEPGVVIGEIVSQCETLHQPTLEERFERICDISERSGEDFSHDTSSEWFQIRDALTRVGNVNVLVTNTQLVPVLCKCLIYQLDAFFPIDCFYTSAKVHKYNCFATILKTVDNQDDNQEVKFVAIGGGLEEEQVSLALGLEFHKIRSLVDLQRLRYDLHLEHDSSSLLVFALAQETSAKAAYHSSAV
ncbi:putative Eyes absent family, EYA domain superfamily [Plasmopara halstedii]